MKKRSTRLRRSEFAETRRTDLADPKERGVRDAVLGGQRLFVA